MTNYDENRILNAIAKLESALEILVWVTDTTKVSSEYSKIQELIRVLDSKII